MIDDFRRPRPRRPSPPSKPPKNNDGYSVPNDDLRPLGPPAQLDPQNQADYSEPLNIEETIELTDDANPTAENNKSEKGNKKPKKQRHLWPQGWSKRKKRLASSGLVLAVLMLASGLGYWYQQSNKTVAPTAKVQKYTSKPTTVASRLSGLQVTPEVDKRSVTGVMIENSPDARPQAGLKDAGVVFEAIAEGGITRFLALFQDTQPDYIGPIRSARPYYIDWLLPFDAAYAHVGGSGEALAQIKQQGVKDMDQFSNSAAYQRVNSRYAPHNVYSSSAKLDQLKMQKGYNTSQFTGFKRKAQAKAATPTAVSIDFSVSGALYNPHYDYQATTNSYARSEGGKAHIDEKSGVQIAPKVVIALVMPHSTESDGVHSRYATVGGGAMFVFQDGLVTKGNWQKASRTAQFSFTNEAGKPLLLNPGQTWLTMVGNSSAVSYKP